MADRVSLADVSWRRSTRCGNSDGSCVEVPFLKVQVLIRDSMDPDGPPQVYSNTEWKPFITGVKQGEFDPASPRWG